MNWFPTFTPQALFGPWRTTSVQRRAVLRLIAVAVDRRVELAPLLEAWAEEEWGGQRGRLRRLSATLREGVPLADAVERHPGVLGDEGNLLVRFGLESGTLPESLSRRVSGRFNANEPEETVYRQAIRYGLVLLVVLSPIALFIQTELMPEMNLIWNEFSLEKPQAMSVSTSVANVVLRLLAGAVGLALLLGAMHLLGWPTRLLSRSVAPRLFQPIRARRVGGVLRLLGEAAAAGRPLTGAISTLARYHYDPAIRQQLLYVRNELALGADPWAAATESRLMTEAESAAAVAAEPPGVLGWTLAALGDRRRLNAERTVHLLGSTLFPLVVFGFGAFVLTQVLGLFVPLVELTEALL